MHSRNERSYVVLTSFDYLMESQILFASIPSNLGKRLAMTVMLLYLMAHAMFGKTDLGAWNAHDVTQCNAVLMA